MKTQLEYYLREVAYTVTADDGRNLTATITNLNASDYADLTIRIDGVNADPFYISKGSGEWEGASDNVVRNWEDQWFMVSLIYSHTERCGWFRIWYKDSESMRATNKDWFNGFQSVQNVLLGHRLWDDGDIDQANDDPAQTLINGINRHMADVAALTAKLKAAQSIIRDISYQRTALDVIPDAYQLRMQEALK